MCSCSNGTLKAVAKWIRGAIVSPHLYVPVNESRKSPRAGHHHFSGRAERFIDIHRPKPRERPESHIASSTGTGHLRTIIGAQQEMWAISITEARYVNRLGSSELGLRSAPIRIHIYRCAHCELGYIPSPLSCCDFGSFAIRCDLCPCDILSAWYLAADIEVERSTGSTSGADINAISMIRA
jgi:hypothetical protein